MKLDKLHISSKLLMPYMMTTPHSVTGNNTWNWCPSYRGLCVRSGKWDLYLSSFSETLPYFAAFDHLNYTRWGLIFLADMKMLPQTAPEVQQAFENGNGHREDGQHLESNSRRLSTGACKQTWKGQTRLKIAGVLPTISASSCQKTPKRCLTS